MSLEWLPELVRAPLGYRVGASGKYISKVRLACFFYVERRVLIRNRSHACDEVFGILDSALGIAGVGKPIRQAVQADAIAQAAWPFFWRRFWRIAAK